MGAARLSINFKSREAMVEWFEEMRDLRAFGSECIPGCEKQYNLERKEEEGLGLEIHSMSHPWTRPKEMGIRKMDILDERKVKSDESFIVANPIDGGYFLELREIPGEVVAEIVIKSGEENNA